MIYGIGADILLVSRIEYLYQTYGEALPKRVLSPLEWHEFSGSTDVVRFIAKRFSAKEAFSKAVGTGIREPVSFRHISVGHDELGKPELMFSNELTMWFKTKNIGRVHLSLSDEKEQILAFVVAEAA